MGLSPVDEPIEIRPYDPRWPDLYNAEAARIAQALRPYALAFEHGGSTAVPGLDAKNVIDIWVAIFRLLDAPWLVARMEGLGYTYRPELEAQMPDRRFFKKRDRNGPGFNIHMVEVSSPMWTRDLLFREFLRTHPQDAAAYSALKRDLAARHGNDLVAYTEAKTPFIEACHAKARQEAEAQRLKRENAGKSPPA